MQSLRSAFRSSHSRIRAAWPRAVVSVAVALDQATRRPPFASLVIQQLLT